MVLNKKIFLNSSSINKDDFIKICLSPDNKLIPDLCDKLPGKSVWLPADKALIVDILRKEDLKTYSRNDYNSNFNLLVGIEAPPVGGGAGPVAVGCVCGRI